MQTGGNANATQFFEQQNCTSNDAQQKYHSRAAQLYREKLHQLAVKTQRIHGTKLFFDEPSHLVTSPNKDKEHIDFFHEHTSFDDKKVQNLIPAAALIQEPHIEDKSKKLEKQQNLM